jgi:fucose permease
MTDQSHFNRNALLITANACMFVFGVILLLMGSLLPSLQVSYSQAGNLGAFPLAGILIATLLVGPIFDLVGAKPVLALALALIAASLSAMSVLHSYSALAASAFIYGLGGGILNTTGNALVADLNADARASALNLLGFSFSLGAVAAPLSLSSLAGQIAAVVVLRYLALLCVLVLVLVLALRFPSGARAGTSLTSLLAVLRHSAVWLFAGLLFFESGSENCMFVWAGKIVGDTLHTTATHANIALVALSAALGGGRLTAAFALRKLGSQRTILLSALVAIVGSLVVLNAAQFSGMIAGMLVIGLGLSTIFPTALGMAGDRFSAETGTVFGATIAVALVGGTTGPKLAGWAASFGVKHILAIPMISAALVMVFTRVIARHEPQPLTKASALP